ncbi:MAG TPA: GGDEF domain-containing protein [Spirochaetales bacterium]|nr:GGDEF domain-containing protein [Spirochaetales bacterium]
MDKASFPEQWLQVFGKFSLDFFVVEMGEQKKVLYKGGKSSSYFGYPDKMFVDQIEGSFSDLVLKADQMHVDKVVREAVKANADIDLQCHLIRYDSSVSLVRIAGSYLYTKDGLPTYLFLISDEKRSIVPFDTKLERFNMSFSVDTGSVVEINLQGRIAFLVHEFNNIYEAITIFSSRYVHPQDRKLFAVFSDARALRFSTSSKGNVKGIAFRRTSYNEVFSGYRWSLLSYSLEEGEHGTICKMLIKDSNKVTSQLAEKTLQTQLDPLTGVLNRSAFESQVIQQIELCSTQECIGAFFMLDIDQFKWINDTYGHDRGDDVLREVTKALRGVFRPTDIIARPGGDEFAIFISGIPSFEVAITKAQNICHALRTIKLSEDGLHLSCSVGVSIYPEHGTTFQDLYHTSDLALYLAKREGKDRYCLYGIQSIVRDKEKPIDREWIFSQMEEEVYLSNVDTYALIFTNEVLRKRVGVQALGSKGYCYEVLHARSSPCADCKNPSLVKGQISIRLRMDEESGVICLVREKNLLLKGEHVKLSVSTPLPQTWAETLSKHMPASFLERITGMKGVGPAHKIERQ